MRRLLAFGCAGLAVLVAAQTGGSDALTSFTQTLNSAKTLNANFTVQRIGGVSNSYTIELAKPDKARIDTPTQLVVADGKNITVLDKKDNSFYKQPQTEAEFNALFKSDELATWSAFFGNKPFKSASTKSLGVKNRKGENLNAVQINTDAKGRKTITLYISAKDNLAKQAEFVISDQGVNETTILATKSIALDGSVSPDAFAFKAPSNAREVSMDEITASKWYTNLEEAKAVAKKTGKKIFVDFMATWCGPCKMLEREVFHSEEFKRLFKHFVMVQIDVDAQPDVAQAYKVTAMPTQMVLDADGNEVGKTVGYGGPAAFYGWIGGFTN